MKIVRMTTGEWGKTKAFFDVEISGFTMKGFKLIEGINGIFVANPSEKDKEGEYRDSVYVEKGAKEKLLGIAIQCHRDGGVSLDKTKPVKKVPQGVDDDIPF